MQNIMSCNKRFSSLKSGVFRSLSFPLIGAGLLLLTSCADQKVVDDRPPLKSFLEQDQSEIENSEYRDGLENQDPKSANADGAENQNDLYRGSGKFLGKSKRASKANVNVTGREILLNFENAELREVVEVILGSTMGVNYIFDPRVEGVVSLKTTGPLPLETVLEILETMLRMNNAALIAEPGLYRVVPLDDVVRQNLLPELAQGGQKIPAGYSVRIVPLKYVSAIQMEKLLEPFLPQNGVVRVDVDRNLIVLAAPGTQMTKMLETVELFDVDLLKGKSVGIFRLNFVTAETLIEELSTVFGSETDGPLDGIIKFVPITRLNALLVLTTHPSYLDRAASWISRLDKGNVAGQNLYVYYVQNGKAADMANVLSDLFSDRRRDRDRQTGRVAPGREALRAQSTQTPAQQAQAQLRAANGQNAAARATNNNPSSRQNNRQGLAFSSDADIRIIADEVNNALLVLASEQDYRMVSAALRKLDVQPLQVLIEATIAEVTLTDDLRYGLQWAFDTGSLGDGLTGRVGLTANATSTDLNVSTPGFSAIVDRGQDIRGVLDALESVTTVNVISSPHLMVQDNQTAELTVGDEVPITTQRQQSIIGGGSTTNANNLINNSVQFRETGVILRVTPRVSSGGTVSLEIEQEVSTVVPNSSTEGTDGLTPTISQRKVSSSVVAQTGQTIVLGGLISNSETKGRTGVPVLSSIPVLGNLFSRTEVDSTRTELVVLITPRVVRNPKEAREVTNEIRQRLHGIRNFERRARENVPGQQ